MREDDSPFDFSGRMGRFGGRGRDNRPGSANNERPHRVKAVSVTFGSMLAGNGVIAVSS